MKTNCDNQKTEEVIAAMLKENTGIAMMDSGGAYGRHWQSNQKRDFEHEPEAWLDVEGGRPEVTINVYHFLARALEYDEEFDKKFQEFANSPENDDKYWGEIIDDFVGTLEASGIYGEGDPVTVNTYNGEDLLSQVIQYTYWEMAGDGTGYVLLQIHGGCDVRGGYTRPRVFRTDIDGSPSIFGNARAYISCENGHGWYTDDAWNWYPMQDEPELELDDEKGAVCPVCGGKLEAWI